MVQVEGAISRRTKERAGSAKKCQPPLRGAKVSGWAPDCERNFSGGSQGLSGGGDVSDRRSTAASALPQVEGAHALLAGECFKEPLDTFLRLLLEHCSICIVRSK